MKSILFAAALFAVAGAHADPDAEVALSCSEPQLRDAGYQVVFSHVGHSTRMKAELFSISFVGAKKVASLPVCHKIPGHEHSADAADPILRCTGDSKYSVLLTNGDFAGRQHAIVEHMNGRFGIQSVARLLCSRPE